MSDHLDSVKEIITFLRKHAEKTAKPALAGELSSHAEAMEGVASELKRLSDLTTALDPELGNLNDLPKELREELSVAKADELEDQLVTVINAYGGTASLDQILVGLYRKFEVVQKRRFLQNKLYRMSNVWSVQGRKGVYTCTPPGGEEGNDHMASEYNGHNERPETYEPDLDEEIPF